MRYRKLGNTGLLVSEVGFGTWGLGGDAYGSTDDAVSMEALHRAVEEGINFFDTSDLYGNGHSERLLGRLPAGVRQQLVIATKGGMLPHRGFAMPQDFSPRHLERALEASLRRLRLEAVPLYQLHSPPETIFDDQPRLRHLLERFVRQGKVITWGVSVRSPAHGLEMIRRWEVPVLQANFNLADQRARDCGLLEEATKAGCGIIVRTPLVFGFLTGRISEATGFEDNDHRRNWPEEQRRRWARAAEKFSFLWRHTGRTQVQAALRFVLDHPAVSTVIPGMLTTGQVIENAATSSVPPLTKEEMETAYRIYHENCFYDQRAKERAGEKVVA